MTGVRHNVTGLSKRLAKLLKEELDSAKISEVELATALQTTVKTLRRFKEKKITHASLQSACIKRYYQASSDEYLTAMASLSAHYPKSNSVAISNSRAHSQASNNSSMAIEYPSNQKQLVKTIDSQEEPLPSGVYWINNNFIDSYNGDLQGISFTPEEFYSFQRHVTWYGVIHEWDAPRSIFPFLFESVTAKEALASVPRAIIKGSGGSGKSILLRRLAIELHKHNHKILFIEEPRPIEGLDINRIIAKSSSSVYLLIDEIENMNECEAIVLHRQLQKRKDIRFIACGRSIPRPFRAILKNDESIFDTENQSDIKNILKKIATVIPDWALSANLLAETSPYNTRLVSLLLILVKNAATRASKADMEITVLDIIASEINNLTRTMPQIPGLANTIIDAAIFSCLRCELPYGLFLSRLKQNCEQSLGYKHQDRLVGLSYAEGLNTHYLLLLSKILGVDSQSKLIRFNHANIAEIIYDSCLLEERVIEGSPHINSEYELALLDFICKNDDNIFSSYGIRAFWENKKITTAYALMYIDLLLSRGVGHFAYLLILVDRSLNIAKEARVEYFLKTIPIIQNNSYFWGRVARWANINLAIEEHYDFFESLYRAGCISSPIVNGYLKSTPKEIKEANAYEVLRNKSVLPDVHLFCLHLLTRNQSLSPENALKIISDPAYNATVAIKCLDDADSDNEIAEQFFKKDNLILNSQPALILEVISRLSYIHGKYDKESALRVAQRILSTRNNNGLDESIICKCLQIAGTNASEYALKILKNRNTLKPELQCWCFAALDCDPSAEIAKYIEDYSHNPELICLLLDVLGDKVINEARKLVFRYECNPDVLVRCLNVLGKEFSIKSYSSLIDRNYKNEEIIHIVIRSLLKHHSRKRTLARNIAQRVIMDKTANYELLHLCLSVFNYDTIRKTEYLLELLHATTIKDEIKTELLDELVVLNRELLQSETMRLIKEYKFSVKDKYYQACKIINHLHQPEPVVEALLTEWWKLDSRLLSFCIKKCRDHAMLKKVALSISNEWPQKISNDVVIFILNSDYNSVIRERRALDILNHWIKHNREVVASALLCFVDKPMIVVEICRMILDRWLTELTYQYYNIYKKGMSTMHLIVAMTHPALHEKSMEIIGEMKKEEITLRNGKVIPASSFVPYRLACFVEFIINGNRVSWDDIRRIMQENPDLFYWHSSQINKALLRIKRAPCEAP